ncbi:hypothetical protein PISMIDRAFT_677131 [Pisolithus microcarpus 441]|uniref:Unplaced genomic scaffold scaffold_23, whole genome shotgun sequence n=1 Tax=Pisolithus microcarpus 441 TaxID=765257 RepID=A0A0C9Z896_9AGAM|nr:hypothetical protein BKA83DRAFT_677123 [Pisolithus microcarpus]KIK25505.1 hypothetical protein PISMIDRAFT_677123 [Pisolithus microcarpus 441]KIK25506.1 hypothetical protein PISMIDRAFT_677131 [Pisolithus microcarpus 441]
MDYWLGNYVRIMGDHDASHWCQRSCQVHKRYEHSRSGILDTVYRQLQSAPLVHAVDLFRNRDGFEAQFHYEGYLPFT